MTSDFSRSLKTISIYCKQSTLKIKQNTLKMFLDITKIISLKKKQKLFFEVYQTIYH